MTEQEWKRRCVIRISGAVKKAGRIRTRDLKRATNYNRGPVEGIAIWYEALESLEKTKRVIVERDEHGNEAVIMLPTVAELLKSKSRKISELQVSSLPSSLSSSHDDNV